jgi:diaminohydroxyphosphoribosylaminopyrimidine deaminase/5-amino-6-(5-phosphoribosylamino)uracil reductase
MTPDISINSHDLFMRRCLDLAARGAGYVAPNPMVGAVLVHNNRIIGEGYHRRYGEPHAEVNCIASVKEEDVNLMPSSVLYVSLEPCAHYGKTPPCADLIIHHKIPKVVVGVRDPFKEVDGKGIEKLQKAGVDVLLGILEEECTEINKRFFTFYTKHRPYVILKWAETANGFISNLSPPSSDDNEILPDNLPGIGAIQHTGNGRLLISNDYTNRLVHKWRSEEAGILIGTNTALSDNPDLTTRLWNGPSPVRLIIDMDLRLPGTLKIFNHATPTIIFNTVKHEEDGNLLYYQVTEDTSLVHQVVNALCHLKIQSVLIEGGARLLQSFIDEQCWDEIRIIKNRKLMIEKGLPAPQPGRVIPSESFQLLEDHIAILKPVNR